MYSHVLRSGSAAAIASRRIRNILGAILGRDGWMWKTHEVKLLNTSSGDLLILNLKNKTKHFTVNLSEFKIRHSVLSVWKLVFLLDKVRNRDVGLEMYLISVIKKQQQQQKNKTKRNTCCYTKVFHTFTYEDISKNGLIPKPSTCRWKVDGKCVARQEPANPSPVLTIN